MLTKKQIDSLAKKIATNLFTNGAGQKAERLLLWCDTDKSDLGGWGFNSVLFEVATEIHMALRGQSVKGAKKAAANVTPAQRESRAKNAAKTHRSKL